VNCQAFASTAGYTQSPARRKTEVCLGCDSEGIWVRGSSTARPGGAEGRDVLMGDIVNELYSATSTRRSIVTSGWLDPSVRETATSPVAGPQVI
jgi:hypothetical protein